jgi:hypothetical protein
MLYPEAQISIGYSNFVLFISKAPLMPPKAKTDKKTSAASKAVKGTSASTKTKPSKPKSRKKAKKAVSDSETDGSEDKQSQEQKIDIECVSFKYLEVYHLGYISQTQLDTHLKCGPFECHHG